MLSAWPLGVPPQDRIALGRRSLPTEWLELDMIPMPTRRGSRDVPKSYRGRWTMKMLVVVDASVSIPR